jgi:hypothetical protein
MLTVIKSIKSIFAKRLWQAGIFTPAQKLTVTGKQSASIIKTGVKREESILDSAELALDIYQLQILEIPNLTEEVVKSSMNLSLAD